MQFNLIPKEILFLLTPTGQTHLQLYRGVVQDTGTPLMGVVTDVTLMTTTTSGI